MPRVRWGISASAIDDFDRSSQFTPYRGPIPPNGVYEGLIKRLQFVAGTRGKLPQLRIGIELVPREGSDEEKRYAGYFLMKFIAVSDKTAFAYAPFCDAIGVSGDDFENNTITDADGNIKKIGRWRNTGEEYIAYQIKDGSDQDGNTRKEVGWVGPIDEEGYDDEDEEYDDDDSAF